MSKVYDIGLQIYWDYEMIVCGKNSIPLIVFSKCFSDSYSLFIYPIAEKLCPLAYPTRSTQILSRISHKAFGVMTHAPLTLK